MLTVRRRRDCPNCGHRWRTYEVSEEVMRKVKAAIRAVTVIRRMQVEEIDEVLLDTVAEDALQHESDQEDAMNR
jgi:transcriptional regulator NrdR family protein